MDTPIVVAVTPEAAKAYESLTEGDLTPIRRAIGVVRQFIIDRKRILYGGTAIDHALRLSGRGQLYEDDAVPDLDFYSPDNVRDAYDLADIFYKMGHTEARAIVGIFPTVMKVDIGGNTWVCDISFYCRELYDKLPFVTYQQMRSVGMDYQRLDMHSSLSFPFDNVPNEVIFDRWEKDTARFMLVDGHFPIVCPKTVTGPSIRHSIPRRWARQMVASGFLAFSMYCTAIGAKGGLLDARCEVTAASLVFDAYDAGVDMVAMSLSKVASSLERSTPCVRREPLMNVFPASLVADTPSGRLTVHSSRARLLSIQTIEVPCGVGGNTPSIKVRVVCVQYLLRWFLAMYFGAEHQGGDPAMTPVYLAHYTALLGLASPSRSRDVGSPSCKLDVGSPSCKLDVGSPSCKLDVSSPSCKLDVKRAECPAVAPKRPKAAKGGQPVVARDSILALSIDTYGNLNRNAPDKNALNRAYSALGDEQRYRQPNNYTPSKGRSDDGVPIHPAIVPHTWHFYQECGKIVEGV